MLTFPDAANLQFRIQFTRSQPPLKPSGTGSSFPAVFVWHFAQAGSHLNRTAILTGFCMQTVKTVGLSKRKKGCSQDCLFSFPFSQTHEKHKHENSRETGKNWTWGLNCCFGYDRRNMPNCQVHSKSFYCSQGDFSFPTYELSGVKRIVVFQDPGYGKTQLHRFLPVLVFHDLSC